MFSRDGSSSSHNSNSSVQTLYEPDRVKIAQLELQIAESNNERTQILLEGQKELIELNARMQGAIIEAEANSFEHSAEVLKSFMHDMNIIAQQRMELLENGHFEVVNKIERLYLDFEKEIQQDGVSYLEKLPKMLEMLEKFPPESSAYKIYAQSIEKHSFITSEFLGNKLKALQTKQQNLIDSSIKMKEALFEHSAKIVEERMKFLESQLESRRELTLQNSNLHLIANGQNSQKLLDK